MSISITKYLKLFLKFFVIPFLAGFIISGLFFGAVDLMSDQPIRSASQFRDVIIHWFMN
jgi:hypothetical protein